MIQSIRSLHTRLRIKGFTLIELAIVLGVAGLLFAGLWRLMSGGNQQLRDQAAASSQTQLISAVKAYLASSGGAGYGQNFMMANNANTNPFTLALPTVNTSLATCHANIPAAQKFFCDYLPTGFTNASANSYGQNFSIRIIGDGSGNVPTTYSYMILTSGGNVIPDSSGGRISASIGGDGGFVYSNNVCGSVPTVPSWACGAYAAWAQKVTDYAFAAPATGGYIVSRTYVAPEQNSNLPWLARNSYPGDAPTTPTFNTMMTNMLFAVPNAGSPNAKNLYFNTSPIPAPAPGVDSIFMGGGALHMGAGSMDGVGGITMNPGNILMAGGNITMGGGGIVLGGGTLTGTTTAAGAPVLLTVDAHSSPAVQINAGCTLSADATCTKGAITVSTGDINVANGQIQATAFYYTSDARMKTNIKPIVDGLSGIEKLKPVSYNFKATGQPSLGIIAQDVEKVYPSLVQDGPNGYKSVAYNGLIAPLISAVQELKKENDDLRQELQKQSARQEKLELMLKDKKQP